MIARTVHKTNKGKAPMRALLRISSSFSGKKDGLHETDGQQGSS